MPTKIVILAAGKGTRMKSNIPKVLHKLAGKSLLEHVIENSKVLNPNDTCIIIGHGSEQVKTTLGEGYTFVEQTEQKGTGHAVQQVLEHLSDDDKVLISYGDVPLTSPETFTKLLALCDDNQIGLLTVHLNDPQGYGRIVRNQNSQVVGIVEQKDASDEQKLISEINTGMLSATGAQLKNLLANIDNNNAQGEYYLTDIFALAANQGINIETVNPDYEWEVAGVNSRVQLSELERIYQLNIATELMEQGASLADPARIDVRGNLTVGTDVVIDINCVFIGDVTIEDGVQIGPNCIIINSSIGKGTVIQANCVIEQAHVGDSNTVGPFARLRPNAKTASSAHIGNFVEIKNSNIGIGTKVNHLTYIGDTDIGKGTNIGAGTITCNYDGANKHRTVMGDDVFIGSNAALVAPVEIASGATVAAGSVIVKNVLENNLAITRSPQKQIKSWNRPKK